MFTMLIGYRGSGKTSVGKRLANDLWLKFADSDAIVTKAAGKNIAQIFKDDGEAGFRDLETAAVMECCKLTDHVVALGGGAVLRDENRAAIKASGAKVIYLKCEPATLLKRIEGDSLSSTSRPPLTSAGGMQEIINLLAEREPLYREVALKELEVTNLNVEEAAKYIAKML